MGSLFGRVAENADLFLNTPQQLGKLPMPIDFTKPVRTRSGQEVTILFTNGRGAYPIGGYIGGSTTLIRWDPNGLIENNPYGMIINLENALEEPETLNFYVNVYKGPSSKKGPNVAVHPLKSDADTYARADRVACLRFELPADFEGRFDD